MENPLTYIPPVSTLNPKFERRSELREVMDDLDLEGEILQKALRQLAIINTWLGGNRVVVNGLKKMVRDIPSAELSKPLEIVDLGCGGGDALRSVARWARRKKIPVKLTGVDANDFTVEYAKELSRNYPEITFIKADCFSSRFLDQSFDFTLCSLFLHHFSDRELNARLKDIKKISRRGVIINDLQRHWLPFYLFRVFAWLLFASKMVIYDGSVSILRGFTREEWINKLLKMEPKSWVIRWKWAFRHQILIKT
ncbi:MAG: methyltransferase domain-containing protein [Bacteroidetes bacterium]|nr:methyltransferase domain-containing protein [Bacteroidota bacterium]